MKEHAHDYESYYHPNLSNKARELGIKAVELRKCTLCNKELTFIFTGSDWYPLFEYREDDEQDILLA